MSGWKLVQSFYMKSYRSSSTFVTVDLLFHELLPFVQNSFSGLFSVMLSHTWMKVCRKLPHEELQSKFNYCHGWPTFPWVIALCSKFVFRNGCRFQFVGVGGGPVLVLQYSQYACFIINLNKHSSQIFRDPLPDDKWYLSYIQWLWCQSCWRYIMEHPYGWRFFIIPLQSITEGI